MATWKFDGLNEYTKQLNKLAEDSEEYIKRAVYEGAKIAADAARSSIDSLRTDDEYHKDGEMRDGPKSEVVDDLRDGFGLAKMRNENGYIYTKVGFHGRNSSGIYNSGAARQIESGTSWMKKQPFITKAVNSKKKQCEEAMAEALDREIKKLVG